MFRWDRRVAVAPEEEPEEVLVTPEDIARENRNDDMAAWLGVDRA